MQEYLHGLNSCVGSISRFLSRQENNADVGLPPSAFAVSGPRGGCVREYDSHKRGKGSALTRMASSISLTPRRRGRQRKMRWAVPYNRTAVDLSVPNAQRRFRRGESASLSFLDGVCDLCPSPARGQEGDTGEAVPPSSAARKGLEARARGGEENGFLCGPKYPSPISQFLTDGAVWKGCCRQRRAKVLHSQFLADLPPTGSSLIRKDELE